MKSRAHRSLQDHPAAVLLAWATLSNGGASLPAIPVHREQARSRKKPVCNSQRGSVIIFVLGVILLTSFLITRLMDRAAVELAAESKASSKTAMRQEAYSALEASL